MSSLRRGIKFPCRVLRSIQHGHPGKRDEHVNFAAQASSSASRFAVAADLRAEGACVSGWPVVQSRVRRQQPLCLLRATVLPRGPFHWGITCGPFASLAGNHRTHAEIGDVETSRVTGPPWRALPAELCALKPPPAAKGWEVRMPPAPSEFPAPQSTYVSPPIIYAQPRPWKPEQGTGDR